MSQVQDAIDSIAPLTVYGKVVDQDGLPVSGAKVRVFWAEVRILPDPGQSMWIDSDTSGEWMITIERAGRFSVRDLERDGYEFDRKTSTYFASNDRDEIVRHTSKDSPLLLTMRKKGESTFLIHNKGRVNFNSEDVVRLDLLDGKSFRNAENQNESEVLPWDIEINATFSEDTQEWSFVITTNPREGTGVIVSNGVMYDAPQSGFEAEYRKAIKLNELRNSLFICIKSRIPSVYSRMVMKFNPGKEKCILMYESWLNPFGLRNLEYDVIFEKEWKLRKQLEQKTKNELQSGKIPIEQDVMDALRDIK